MQNADLFDDRIIDILSNKKLTDALSGQRRFLATESTLKMMKKVFYFT